MLILFMSRAPADVGFYKGVIYKTNEKSKQFAEIRGSFMRLDAGRKRNRRGTSALLSELILLLY